jgi:hypothetical protein
MGIELHGEAQSRSTLPARRFWRRRTKSTMPTVGAAITEAATSEYLGGGVANWNVCAVWACPRARVQS